MSQPSSGRPLPAYIYRRRRLAVFGGLAVVIVLFVLLLTHPWSGGAQSGTPKADAVIPATASPAATAGGATNTGSTPACTSAQVKVTAYTDADTYAAGQFPQLSLGVKNTGDQACALNAGSSQLVFTVSGGGESYWISTDCQTESSDYELVLQPGQTVNSEPIQWDRTRSNPGTCKLTQRDPVPAGGAAYKLTASVGGNTSAAAQFTLN